MKHLIILDTNGWSFDDEKAKWFADIGGYKAQISLDSMIAEEHDSFRGKKGSFERVIRSLEASKKPTSSYFYPHASYVAELSVKNLRTCVSFAETMTYHYTSHSQSQLEQLGNKLIGCVKKRCRSVEVFRD